MRKLEEIAKAAHEAQWGEGSWDDSTGESERAESFAIARAVINPLREPSHAMLEAARIRHWERTGCQFSAEDYEALFVAMIDVILNEADAG